MFNGYYGSGAAKFYSIAGSLVAIAKIITVIVFAMLDVFGGKSEKKSESEKGKDETKTPEEKN